MCGPNLSSTPFLNDFDHTAHPKINFGVQKLYVIGLMDMLPMPEILAILKKYLSYRLHSKLVKYCQLGSSNTWVSWTQVKENIDKRNNIQLCSQELLDLLSSLKPAENQCKIFHLGQNVSSTVSEEPTHSNTEAMVLDFMTYIYRRNILASIVKYYILKDFIHQLSLSALTVTRKGLLSQILQRLNEIIFEVVLLSFNGANYDNYLIMNPLLLCMTKLKHKIFLFKKGSQISTIKCTIKRNIQAKPNKKLQCDFTSHLYIKDIRFMVAGNMSLDRIGQLFNISFKKLAFPYEKATDIKTLKNITSLHPTDDLFWNDTFTSRTPALADRLRAQELFEFKNFMDLYQFSVYYLSLDCCLLHSIVLTIFNTYLHNGINIFIRRNFSQSNLSFQELFITQPARQIEYNLAPKRFSHPFLNYFIKKSVTGGLCTSFVHNTIDSDTVINSHLRYVNLQLDKKVWPNFQNIESLVFDKTPAGILTLDIRSLYPAASCKPIPVNTPIIYTRFTLEDFRNVSAYSARLNLKSFCTKVQSQGNMETDYFKLINKPPRFAAEYSALNEYLKTLPADIEIIRFQSSFTALGQCFFGNYPVDGLLSFLHRGIHNIHIIQYNSVFRHGHLASCTITNSVDQQVLAEKTHLVERNITNLYENFIKHFKLKNVKFQYISLSECNYPYHEIPGHSTYMIEYKKKYKYNNFVQAILNKKLTGFIVVRNLELRHQNPLFGFLVQKCIYKLQDLSPYTQEILHHFNESEKVISLHKCSGFMVISTYYFNWLYNNFDFSHPPDIYHGVFFKFERYLKNSIETKLKMRTDLKEKIKTETNLYIKQNLEVQAELIKLCLNSCYGFTLCNLGSSKFKSFRNAQSLPRHKMKNSKILSSIKLAEKVYLHEITHSSLNTFSTMLGHVGSNILFFSKIILLKRLYFVLKHLNPSKSQLLYMDTDSAHILLHHEKLEDNIDHEFRQNFLQLYDHHFEKYKLAGIWVSEGFYEKGQYIGEKSYILKNPPTSQTLSHMKGLNRYFQARFVNENIDPTVFTHINYNIFQKTADFIIFKTYMSKNLFLNYIPVKRYFVCASGSLPLKIQ
jgi:DNA polymerase family B